MAEGHLILAAGLLLAAGLGASLLAMRVRVPGLVLFLAVGMAVGSDGLDWIAFSDYSLARTIGIIALTLILFEGGLTSGLVEIRPVVLPAISLALVGTLVTALVTGLVATTLFDLSLKEGVLVGSILASTDGAAIFSLLRSSTLSRRLARTLEGESGFNDPIAVLLVIGLIDWIQKPGYGIADMLLLFVQQIGIGTVVGLALGVVAVQAFRRAQLASAGLYPVASLAFVALSFGLADTLHGSGFLAVYLVGLMLGSANIPAKQTTTNFHQGLAWVAQLTLFVTLGLLVFPGRLDEVAVKGTVLALALVFVARPLGAALATAPFGYSWREKVIVGWAGLRGAVPVVLATFPVIDHVAGSLEYFDIVFFAVLLSTILQGSTFEWVARRLGLTTDEPALPKPLMEAGTIRRLGAEVLEYSIDAGDAIVGASVRDLALPRDAVVNVIVRDSSALPPRGSTRLRAGDRLHVLVTERSAPQLRALTDRWRTGPVGPPLRPPVTVSGRALVLSAWRWRERDGDAAQPAVMDGQPVILQLRIRRDRPGGLWVLQDGRYAITGPVAAVGGYRDLAAWARRRMRHCDPDERGWLETVVGALAAEVKSPGGAGAGPAS